MAYWNVLAVIAIALLLFEGICHGMTKVGVTLVHWLLAQKKDATTAGENEEERTDSGE